jgi:hypothetical protein
LPPLELHLEGGISHNPRTINAVVLNRATFQVEAFVYAVEIPYTGASGLFVHQPDTSDLARPLAKLNSGAYRGTITIEVVATEDVTSQDIKVAIDKELEKVNRYIGYQALQLDPFNDGLRAEVERIVYGRRNKILKIRNIAAALGYPLHRRVGAPETYVSPQSSSEVANSIHRNF